MLVFVLLGYLFGNFNSDRDLLVAAAIAAVVAVLIAIWLRPGKHGEGEPGMFDERATRRAVRRGVIRTAFVAVVWVVAAPGRLVLEFLSSAVNPKAFDSFYLVFRLAVNSLGRRGCLDLLG